MAVRIVAHAFEIIHLLSDQNPIQVLVDAIVNTGPREDSTRIGSQGTVRRQAVDVSPLRRVNQAISLLTIGVRISRIYLMNWDIDNGIDPRVGVPQRQVGGRVPRRRAHQRRQGLLQLVRHQKEGRARARRQVQPLIGRFWPSPPWSGPARRWAALLSGLCCVFFHPPRVIFFCCPACAMLPLYMSIMVCLPSRPIETHAKSASFGWFW